MKKPELWPAFAACLVESLTVRAAAARLGVDKDTSWRWRHGLLAAHARLGTGRVRGTVEVVQRRRVRCDKGARHLGRPARVRGTTGHLVGGEGVWITIATDRDGGAAVHVLGRRPNHASIAEFVAIHFAGVRMVLGQARPLSAWQRAVRGKGIPFRRVSAWGDPVAGRSPFHVLNAARYAQGFEDWLARFRGVASKYLHRYLHWYWLLEPLRSRPMRLVLETGRAPPPNW